MPSSVRRSRLKESKGRPNIKPSALDQSIEPSRSGMQRQHPGRGKITCAPALYSPRSLPIWRRGRRWSSPIRPPGRHSLTAPLHRTDHDARVPRPTCGAIGSLRDPIRCRSSSQCVPGWRLLRSANKKPGSLMALLSPSWPGLSPGLSRPSVVALCRYGWPGQSPALTLAAGFIQVGSANGRCGTNEKPGRCGVTTIVMAGLVPTAVRQGSCACCDDGWFWLHGRQSAP